MFWNGWIEKRPLLVVVPHSGETGRPRFSDPERESCGRMVTYLFFPHEAWLDDRQICRATARRVARRYQQFDVILLHHKLGQRRFDRAVVRFLCMIRKQGIRLARTSVMVPERPVSGPVAWLFKTRTCARLCRTFAEYHSEKCAGWREALRRNLSALSAKAAKLF